MRCAKCGADNPNNSGFCRTCGAAITEEGSAVAEFKAKRRSRWAALFCAWCGCGAYQLYMGDIPAAKARLKSILLSLLLCTVAVGVLLLLYDIFLMLKDFFYVAFTKDELYDEKGNPVTWR